MPPSSPPSAPIEETLAQLQWPVEPLPVLTWVDALAQHPLLKGLLPLLVVAAAMVPVWWFFRKTWTRLNGEAAAHQKALADAGRLDPRPIVCLILVALTLTLQEYYGGRTLYEQLIQPALESLDARVSWVKLKTYSDFYSHLWWAVARVIGYVLIPFPLWKLCFPRDSLLDLGLRTRGLLGHAWIYGACLAFVLPAMLLVARQPDFASYYPFYSHASRSWWDLLIWECAYFAQFLALEMFFRGFILGALRKSLGSVAIFVMVVPYCMIHYGKPYLEAQGAILAGVVLGSLAIVTRSIYAGFAVHITVAGLMDTLSLWNRDALPKTFWPG